MIGIVDVEVQAANPQMPLCPFVAFVGSPSSVRVRNVPGNVGSWNITKVYVSANYPDNSIQSRECTRVGEIYVGTLPACNAVGKGANGFVVSADGVDESGNAVTGYVLGKGDLEILDADGAITPGVTTHYVHGLDEQPSDPHEYDIYKDGDTWKIYFDGAWGSLAPALTLDDAVTRTSANGVKSSGIWSALWGALAALPTGFTSLHDWCVSQLAGKLDKSGGTVTGSISMLNGILDAGDVQTHTYFDFNKPNVGPKYLDSPENSGKALTDADIQDSSSALGAALAGKQSTLSAQQLANIAAVPNKANASDLLTKLDSTSAAPAFDPTQLYIFGDFVTKDGVLYQCEDASVVPGSGWNLESWGVRTILGIAAQKASNPTAGNLAALDANGNPTDAGWTAGDLARYSLTTKTITNGAVTLDDRASNAVTISATLSPNTLTINFPAATSGKVRDFAMRLNIAAGVTAPEIAWPQGVTLENDGGEVPEIADGGTGGSSTILYFSETENNGTTAKFLVKGETLTAIAQA